LSSGQRGLSGRTDKEAVLRACADTFSDVHGAPADPRQRQTTGDKKEKAFSGLCECATAHA